MDIRIFQNICIEKNIKLALAESCTGGSIASKITSISDSSKYFLGSIVAYSDEMKVKLLEVPKDLINKYSAVSEEVAYAMVEGILKQTGCGLGCSITGYADGEALAGEVYCAIGTKEKIAVIKLAGLCGLDRRQVIEKCVNTMIKNLYDSVMMGEVILVNK